MEGKLDPVIGTERWKSRGEGQGEQKARSQLTDQEHHLHTNRQQVKDDHVSPFWLEDKNCFLRLVNEEINT